MTDDVPIITHSCDAGDSDIVNRQGRFGAADPLLDRSHDRYNFVRYICMCLCFEGGGVSFVRDCRAPRPCRRTTVIFIKNGNQSCKLRESLGCTLIFVFEYSCIMYIGNSNE